MSVATSVFPAIGASPFATSSAFAESSIAGASAFPGETLTPAPSAFSSCFLCSSLIITTPHLWPWEFQHLIHQINMREYRAPAAVSFYSKRTIFAHVDLMD